jgi:hypothetical protein
MAFWIVYNVSGFTSVRKFFEHQTMRRMAEVRYYVTVPVKAGVQIMKGGVPNACVRIEIMHCKDACCSRSPPLDAVLDFSNLVLLWRTLPSGVFLRPLIMHSVIVRSPKLEV